MNKTEQLITHDLMVLARLSERTGKPREPMDVAKTIALDHGLDVNEVYSVVLNVFSKNSSSNNLKECSSKN